ncbi:uncharacterized protein LOC144104271 [Amblyomma americanum]
MARSFRFHARLCRLCGCFFIRDLFEGNGRSPPRIVWKSWYTVYSCGCLASLLWIEIDVIVGEGYQANKRFYFLDNTLQVITRTVVLVKVLINLFCLFIGSSRILEFYLRAADFEKRAGISSCACCAPRKYFWSDLRRACLCVVYCSVFVVAQLLAPRADMSHHRGSGRGWMEAYAWTRFVLSSLFYFAYDSVHNMALISSCKVLVEYLRSQLKVLEECIYCCQGNGPPSSRYDTATRVEMVRMRLCDIEELKNAVNDIWKWPLVATSVCVLLVLCTAVYDVCKGGLASRDNYGSCFYALYLMYEFLALTFVSQSLANMGKRIKGACKVAGGIDNDPIRHQIRYLHECLDAEDLCLTGGDFFKLTVSLLVSMAVAIITYTVILLQTSQSVMEESGSNSAEVVSNASA